MNQSNYQDHLWKNITSLPYFRGLLRAVEGRFYEGIPLIEPTLDVGCGDGHFAQVTFDRPIAVGIDPWTPPLLEAKKRNIYQLTILGSGADVPFEDAQFATVISNSVLEHIPDLDPVLAEVNRVMRSDGRFIFCVPNHRFLPSLSVSNFLDKIGLKSAANKYRSFFNRISRHHHCDDFPTWEERLNRTGFVVVDHWDYFSPHALSVLEWGHYFGLPSLVSRLIFKKWILMAQRWNFVLLEPLLRRIYNEPEKISDGVYSFYIAQKL
ncbi:MAG: class I SAM-dependent methyltransferase [Anaerolineaceae bacterium]|nr:class I SAM-dependent methyltransferase [Anaerolineaceae bacterium]